MDPGIRVVAAGGVILSGIVLASLFRHPSAEKGQATVEGGSPLVLRKHEPLVDQPPMAGGEGGAEGSLSLPREMPPLVARRPTILRPLERSNPAPPLARNYPAQDEASADRWGTSIGIGLPEAAPRDPLPRRHKIVDGDTLEGLAQQYLGSTDRYLEIYEANRGVLPSPRLLPIGVELKIPSLPRAAISPEDGAAERPLVPVPPLEGEGR